MQLGESSKIFWLLRQEHSGVSLSQLNTIWLTLSSRFTQKQTRHKPWGDYWRRTSHHHCHGGQMCWSFILWASSTGVFGALRSHSSPPDPMIINSEIRPPVGFPPRLLAGCCWVSAPGHWQPALGCKKWSNNRTQSIGEPWCPKWIPGSRRKLNKANWYINLTSFHMRSW